MDVFSRADQNLADVIPIDAASLGFSSGDGTIFGVGMMTQNSQIGYQQQISRIYEIGTNYTYFIGGRTAGQIGLGRIVGPRPIQVAFYTKYGNMCNAKSNNINLTMGFNDCAPDPLLLGPNSGGATIFNMKYCVITQLGITVQANDMLVNEALQLMFVSLEVSQAGGVVSGTPINGIFAPPVTTAGPIIA